MARSDLEKGEKLIWIGQPRPGRMMLGTIPLVLFAIPWTAFSVFWIGMTLTFAVGIGEQGKGAGAFRWFGLLFPLFGVPFLLIGVGMLSAPWWVWRRAKRTCYAVTDRRAVTWVPGVSRGMTVRSFRPAELGRIVRSERSDGSGDLVFEERGYRGSRGHRRTTRCGFFAIPNVRDVEQLIQETLLNKGNSNADQR